jgi:hypothetical protein
MSNLFFSSASQIHQSIYVCSTWGLILSSSSVMIDCTLFHHFRFFLIWIYPWHFSQLDFSKHKFVFKHLTMTIKGHASSPPDSTFSDPLFGWNCTILVFVYSIIFFLLGQIPIYISIPFSIPYPPWSFP